MPLYTFIHNLLNALVQIANKMGSQKNSTDRATRLADNLEEANRSAVGGDSIVVLTTLCWLYAVELGMDFEFRNKDEKKRSFRLF
jgi:shikimate kinase